MPITMLAALLVSIGLFAQARPLAAAAYVWPLSNSVTPDAMNTSFGPRIDTSRWDFHDGCDLPAPLGTPVYAVRGGTVYREGPGGTDGYSSRHVILRIDDPVDGTLYALYLHLSAIDPSVIEGTPVVQGQNLGAVGMDDATYTHLHFEIRRGSALQIASVHPLRYLPYTDTVNFSAPAADRFNRIGGEMAARLLFGAADKNEGDLARVEVDLENGVTVLSTRVVDLDDKTTVNEGNGDKFEWKNDIALEGYQRSNMIGDGRADLEYGILVRRLPPAVTNLVARVYDKGGNVSTGAAIPVPNQASEVRHLDFEDGAMPPPAWTSFTSSSGTGTTVANDSGSARVGSRGMSSVDLSVSEPSTQTASIGFDLPPGRFQWVAEGWFDPASFSLSSGSSLYFLEFLNGTNLSVAAAIRNNAGAPQAGLFVKNPDASTTSSFSAVTIAAANWKRWTLELLRTGTRETTAVLYLDGVEQVRKNWEGTTYEPLSFRTGIALSFKAATATVASDEIRVSDGGRLSLPSFAPGHIPDGFSVPGTPLTIAKQGAALSLSWGLSCNTGGTDFLVAEGALGLFASHAPKLCSTAGLPSALITPPPADSYYLVAPRSDEYEGSYGVDSAGVEHPPASVPCQPQLPGGC